MSRGFTFEVSARLNTVDYRKFLKDPQQVDKVSQNLEKSQLWGWCVPEVRAKFDKYVGVSQSTHGSYISEEDFRSSPDYEYLEEAAIRDIQFEIDSAKRIFKQTVEEYYENYGEKYNDVNKRLIRFE